MKSDFVFGNILNEKSLQKIIEYAILGKNNLVNEFLRGIDLCENNCEYFNFCGGGFAANKFYENGGLETTITRYCTSQIISPVEVLVKNFGSPPFTVGKP